MFTIRRTSNFNSANLSVDVKPAVYQVTIATLVIGATALAGCGQKGDLYLVDSGSQAIKNSTAILDSGSNPQDAAFANIDGSQQNNEQDTDDFQLPEPSNDPNDY